MSPKELLYIEDALGHETQIKTTCNQASQQLQDADLKNLATQIADKHAQCFNKFYGLLGGN